MFKSMFNRQYILTLSLCLSLATVAGSHAEEKNDVSAGHAQVSERLVKVMRQLFTVVHEEDKVDNADISRDNMTDLIESAEELLFYAEVMSNKIPVTELEETESVIFSALADRLYDEALNIQQLATTYEASDSSQHQLLNEAYHRLNRTCNACHQTFRDQPSQE